MRARDDLSRLHGRRLGRGRPSSPGCAPIEVVPQLSRILLVDRIESLAEKRLAASAELVRPDGFTVDDLAAAASDADAIIVRTSLLTSTILSQAARLRVIGKHGIGLDNVDVGYATERGVVVIHTPNANTAAVAEFTLACVLLLLRPIIAGDRALRTGRFTEEESLVEQAPRLGLVGREINGQTVGIVGWGAIGRRVGLAVSSLGAHVVAYDPFVSDVDMRAWGAIPASDLDGLLAIADVVTLHVPSTPETVGLVGSRELAAMQQHAVLVNTSRGAVVDEEALTAALRTGTIRAAAIDVYSSEPPPADHPLLMLDNVICTPHLGGATTQSLRRMAEDVVDGVLAVLAGEVPPGVANPQALRTQAKGC
jgi:D-3-phosphoglycerate dehydrogenase / 2-oxoglutarate reductase